MGTGEIHTLMPIRDKDATGKVEVKEINKTIEHLNGILREVSTMAGGDSIYNRGTNTATSQDIIYAKKAVKNLTGNPFMLGAEFTWSTDLPSVGYYRYRIKIGDDAWGEWRNTTTPLVVRMLTESEADAYPSGTTINIQVYAVGTDGKEYLPPTQASVNTEFLSAEVTSLDDFDQISGAFPGIPVVVGAEWTSNDPGAGQISWNSHSLWYDGEEYEIPAGNTGVSSGNNAIYVWWDNGDSEYTVTAAGTHPSDDGMGSGDFIIAVNENGTAHIAWNSVANQVIGTAYIQNAAIVDAKILDLSADKIKAGTILTPGVYIGSAYYGDGTAIDDLQPTDAGATNGANWETNLDFIPTRFGESESIAGLYVTNNYIGYYDGVSAWGSYIDSSGDFYFGGDENNYISWDGSDMTIATANADGITIANGGGIKIEEGGDLTLEFGAYSSGALAVYAGLGLGGMIHGDGSYDLLLSAGVPGTSECDFGDPSNKWEKINMYVDDALVISGDLDVAGEITSHDHDPLTTTTYDLGSTSKRWNNIYGVNGYLTGDLSVTDDITCDDITCDDILCTYVANESGQLTIRGTNISFRYGAADQLWFTNNVFRPVTDSAVDLGTSAYYWKTCYADAFYENGGGYNDTLDDLEILDAMQPEPGKKNKHGHDVLDLTSLPEFMTNFDDLKEEVEKEHSKKYTKAEFKALIKSQPEIRARYHRKLSAFIDISAGGLRQIHRKFKRLRERVEELERKLP